MGDEDPRAVRPPCKVARDRLAICKRCRWPERIAAGADHVDALVSHAKATTDPSELHVRASQCLNSCDAGHTVRVESRGLEVAIVGVRTRDELTRVTNELSEITAGRIPEWIVPRVYQVWIDGELVYHRSTHGRFEVGLVEAQLCAWREATSP